MHKFDQVRPAHCAGRHLCICSIGGKLRYAVEVGHDVRTDPAPGAGVSSGRGSMSFTILTPCDDEEDAGCLPPILETHNIAHEVVGTLI